MGISKGHPEACKKDKDNSEIRLRTGATEKERLGLLKALNIKMIKLRRRRRRRRRKER